eukprot:2854204-Pyramimonas_sp.AAC.1
MRTPTLPRPGKPDSNRCCGSVGAARWQRAGQLQEGQPRCRRRSGRAGGEFGRRREDSWDQESL